MSRPMEPIQEIPKFKGGPLKLKILTSAKVHGQEAVRYPPVHMRHHIDNTKTHFMLKIVFTMATVGLFATIPFWFSDETVELPAAMDSDDSATIIHDFDDNDFSEPNSQKRDVNELDTTSTSSPEKDDNEIKVIQLVKIPTMDKLAQRIIIKRIDSENMSNDVNIFTMALTPKVEQKTKSQTKPENDDYNFGHFDRYYDEDEYGADLRTQQVASQAPPAMSHSTYTTLIFVVIFGTISLAILATTALIIYWLVKDRLGDNRNAHAQMNPVIVYQPEATPGNPQQ